MTSRDRAKTLSLLIAVDGSVHSDSAVRWAASIGASGLPVRCILLNAAKSGPSRLPAWCRPGAIGAPPKFSIMPLPCCETPECRPSRES